ncbi:MAG: cysteine desulfurase-like protein [Actinomycetota bacterium]|nr:cysteine desulfurase-like protein [Actinomycetota bacterium]
MSTEATEATEQPATFDVEAFRSQFPSLRGGAAHFDGPGGSQTPSAVADAIASTLTSPMANRGRATVAERNADDTVLAFRSSMADFLGADPRGVVFGRSMTQLTMDLARTLSLDWAPGDEVVVSRLDHDANIRPWVIAAQRVGAVVRWVEFDPWTGELDPADLAPLLGARTRLVAVTAASNLIGTMPDVAAIADRVHDVDALLFVDAVHYAAHHRVDLGELRADVVACSPYKFLGPHCGVLAADPALLETLHPDKLLPSGDAVPERFELGTLPYELMAGTTAAVEVLAAAVPGGGTLARRLTRSMDAIDAHENALRVDLEHRLVDLPGVTCRSRAHRRTPTLLLEVAGHEPAAVHAALGERGVNAPGGSFYALEASRHLGLGSTGGVRVGLAAYTTADDCDRLVEGLAEIVG